MPLDIKDFPTRHAMEAIEHKMQERLSAEFDQFMIDNAKELRACESTEAAVELAAKVFCEGVLLHPEWLWRGPFGTIIDTAPVFAARGEPSPTFAADLARMGELKATEHRAPPTFVPVPPTGPPPGHVVFAIGERVWLEKDDHAAPAIACDVVDILDQILVLRPVRK